MKPQKKKLEPYIYISFVDIFDNRDNREYDTKQRLQKRLQLTCIGFKLI